MIGVLSGSTPIDAMQLTTGILFSNARINGIYVGSRRMFEEMNQAIRLHHLRPVIDKVFAFEQAQDAFVALQKTDHFGKLVIRVG
ncbi:protein of unknown function [Georgfuchsia toluolica]|uniref:Alcohol dehydrogenase n=1 Tax=Georgfuchsia toluolica TaxID=424218 RepID=A0A916NA27_9PROT|nr:protein of unknown function [Georgfuchsia toluolica]